VSRFPKEGAVLERFTWFRQSAMRYAANGLTLYIDPWGTAQDDPPADVILLTHAHFDHYQPHEIDRLRRHDTKLVAPKDVAGELSGDVTSVAPGETLEAAGVKIHTVPAYNIVEERLDMHPQAKGWVGYLIELEDRTYYHAGDTDALPELERLRTDVAMVPIGGTYTMDWREAAGFVKRMEPALAVPMHFGFVVCSPTHADYFKDEVSPIAVEVLHPTNPFEQT
jgi:L-ascorbate metabolism protein UlaG (beta-lactamase superfamily)